MGRLGKGEGAMDIIDRVTRRGAKGDRPIVDTVTLTWEQRRKARQKLLTGQGIEIALALPTGTQLHAGDLLATAKGWIEVQPALEDVLLIKPRTLQETAFVAYQIGNRHLPLEIEDLALKTLHEPVLAAYLAECGLPVECVSLPFTPVSATSVHQHG